MLAIVLSTLALLTAACDCIWTARGYAWLDENRNGVQDAGEPPLEGVMFLIDDVRNGYQRVGERGVSDAEGNAEFGVFIAGCPPTEFEVYALAPAGYEHTTPPRLPAGQRRNNEEKERFAFGFAYAPGVTPTPRPTPSPMACRVFTVPYIDTSYRGGIIAFARDGTGWTASNVHEPRLLALAPDGRVTEFSRAQDPLGGFAVNAMAVDADGAVWVGASEGLSRFQPQTGRWDPMDGLRSTRVQDLSVLGAALIVHTEAGVEARTPSGDWRLLIPRDQIQNEFGEFIELDGSVFYLSNDELLRIWEDPDDGLQWRTLWRRDEREMPMTWIADGDMAAADVLWLAGKSDELGDFVASWTLADGEITPYTFQSTGGVLGKARIANIAVGPGGGVWVGVQDELIRGVASGADAGSMIWTVHDARSLHVPSLDDIRHLAVSPDGALWVRTTYSWIRCTEPHP